MTGPLLPFFLAIDVNDTVFLNKVAAEGRKLDTQFFFLFFGQFYHIEINFVLTRGDM